MQSDRSTQPRIVIRKLGHIDVTAKVREVREARRVEPPICHPDRKHLAWGLCRICYANRPETREANRISWAKYDASKRRKDRQKTKDFLDKLKSVPCMDCNGSFTPECMDFDHRPGEKKINQVSKLRNWWKIEHIMEEVAKCDIICANCHRIRTIRRKKELMAAKLSQQ